jgi:hypothetical protein
MTFNVSIYDLISWLITVISVMLFIFERKKNSRTPYYMAVQGILRACKSKAGFYGSHSSHLKSRNNGKNISVPLDEYILFADTVTSDFMSLMEHVMGSLKSIEPEKDMPFDTMEFTQRQNSNDTKQEKA